METSEIQHSLQEFHGTEGYHKHLFPGKSPILLTDGCSFVRRECKAYWLFDAILSYQCDKLVGRIPFQKWILKQQRKDLTWLLLCYDGEKLMISQKIEFSDFPLPGIEIWVIDKVCLLPSEY